MPPPASAPVPAAANALRTARRLTAIGWYSNSLATMTNLYEEFAWRGMVSDAPDGLSDAIAKKRVAAYIGFAPTAPSLHVGSLLRVMGLARLQRFGSRRTAMLGGGTGMLRE